VATADAKPVELVYHFLFVESSGDVATVTMYKQQLRNVLADCPQAAAKTSTVHYTEKEIKNLFLDYLKCTNRAGSIEVTKSTPVHVQFGITGGAMYNQFKFSGDGRIYPDRYEDIAVNKYSSNLSPVIGVSLTVGLQRKSNKWSLVNELVYKSYKTSSTSFVHTVLYDYTNQTNISFSYLQLNTLLRYNMLASAMLKPFINAGMGNARQIAERENTSHLTYNNGVEKTVVAFAMPNNYERSLLLGAGIASKKMQFECRYGLSNGFSPYVRFKSKVRSPQLLVTYQF
jgi:hypothetical protein